MAFPALIPLGISLARIRRNASDDGVNEIVPHMVRTRSVIDKMVKGGNDAPITQWSEAKLEKAIKRNSVFRDHADELRLARTKGVLAALTSKEAAAVQATEVVQTTSPIAPVGHDRKVEEGQLSSIPDKMSQADLLFEEAEVKSEGNPVRDAALELLADNSFDALLITDPAGIIAYSNKAFTKLTGYDQADVIGKSPKLLQGPGTDRTVIARLNRSMQKGDGDYEGSAINYKKNGMPFIMHWRVVPVKVRGEIKAWVAIQREGSQIPTEDLPAKGMARTRSLSGNPGLAFQLPPPAV